jgi:ubiquinone/menaquinone biosynthesis C-methylase UbiE
MKNSKKRFSDRVENYVKYRPHYPKKTIELLIERINLKREWIIADIGSGTGISSELFIENGNTVLAVEPNKEMRLAAEKYFKEKSNFISVNGSAENTTLENGSLDLIISGQAFHWFDIKATRKEFLRILKDQKYVVIFWNERKTEESDFQKEYELFLRKYCDEYGGVTQKNISTLHFEEFFGSRQYDQIKLFNSQQFNFEGLKGRLQSSSYSPDSNNPIYPEMIDSLRIIFDKYATENHISFEYDTEIYYGKFS